jgi:hypothetical protein
VITPSTHPAGTKVECVEPPTEDYAVLTRGRHYAVEYWDGCCIHVTGDDGIGATLNADRFQSLPDKRNPNNCKTCDHKRNPEGGWCYMFREEPTDVCMQHTGLPRIDFTSKAISRILLAVVPHKGPVQ